MTEVSSSNDEADPIRLPGRATDHYPMLKKSFFGDARFTRQRTRPVAGIAMVSSGDLPSDFNLASFFAKPDFRVFQHNRPNAVTQLGAEGCLSRGGKPSFAETRSDGLVHRKRPFKILRGGLPDRGRAISPGNWLHPPS